MTTGQTRGIALLLGLVLAAPVWGASITHELKCEVPSDPTVTHLRIWKESASSGKRTMDQHVPLDREVWQPGSFMPFMLKKPAWNAAKWHYYCGSFREAPDGSPEPDVDAIKEDAGVVINWKLTQ